MKKSVLILSVLSLCLFGQSGWAESRLQQVKQQGVVKVCIWPGYFAISYRNPRTNKLEGVDIEMAGAFAEHLGVELEFVESSFARLVENMGNDHCDIAMHGVGIRESRKPFMDFSQPHLSSGIYAVGMKSNGHIQQWRDIDQPGNVVVVQKGTYMEPVMRDYLKQAELSVVDSFKAREQEVQSGRADVFMTDYPYGKRMAELTQWALLMAPAQPLAPTPYAYAVPKGDAQWLAEVDRFLDKVKANGQLRRAAEKHGLGPIVVDH
ncbi:MAG: ABC transporter substrate-binding protein [Amphritea sp.]|nr:ABC transporter substrate-binding protein [Amphritea sp.]